MVIVQFLCCLTHILSHCIIHAVSHGLKLAVPNFIFKTKESDIWLCSFSKYSHNILLIDLIYSAYLSSSWYTLFHGSTLHEYFLNGIMYVCHCFFQHSSP
jgi:hypothetical protein